MAWMSKLWLHIFTFFCSVLFFQYWKINDSLSCVYVVFCYKNCSGKSPPTLHFTAPPLLPFLLSSTFTTELLVFSTVRVLSQSWTDTLSPGKKAPWICDTPPLDPPPTTSRPPKSQSSINQLTSRFTVIHIYLFDQIFNQVTRSEQLL